jgi:hypothetical protein
VQGLLDIGRSRALNTLTCAPFPNVPSCLLHVPCNLVLQYAVHSLRSTIQYSQRSNWYASFAYPCYSSALLPKVHYTVLPEVELRPIHNLAIQVLYSLRSRNAFSMRPPNSLTMTAFRRSPVFLAYAKSSASKKPEPWRHMMVMKALESAPQRAEPAWHKEHMMLMQPNIVDADT